MKTSNHLVIHFEGWAADPRNMPGATVVVNDGFLLFQNSNAILSSKPDFWYIYFPWIEYTEAAGPYFPTEYYNDRRCCMYAFPWNGSEESSVRGYLLPSKIDINLSDFSFNIYGNNDTVLGSDYSNRVTVKGVIPEANRSNILSMISLRSVSCTATATGGVPILQTIWTELYGA